MRKKKKIGVFLLTAAIVFSALVLPKTHAAGPIDINKNDCKITVNFANNVYSAGTSTSFGELETLGVEVRLYRVASVDVSGDFTGIGKFSGVDLSGMSIDEDDNAVAEYWEDKASEVKGIVDANASIEKFSKTTSAGEAIFTGLQTGLYLVDAQTKESTTNVYNFKPYLIALPGNNYNPSVAASSDAWVYEITVGLKPEKADRYGDIKIVKNLNIYNETIDGATFVFKVEASKTDVDTKESKPVYSDVVAIDFNAPGMKEVLISDIPAGAKVTVTEVYTGASYKLTSEASKETVIIADGEPGAPATVDFSNTYDGYLNGGNGIVNSFIYSQDAEGNAVWSHSAMSDSTSAQPRQ